MKREPHKIALVIPLTILTCLKNLNGLNFNIISLDINCALSGGNQISFF